MDKITVLQLGKTDWHDLYSFPGNIECDYKEVFSVPSLRPYEVTIWDRNPDKTELKALYRSVMPYTLFLTEGTKLSKKADELFRAKKGQVLKRDNIQSFLIRDIRYFFPGSYGEKFRHNNLYVSPSFQGEVSWSGQYALHLKGDFGDGMRQVAFWRNRIPVFAGQSLDLWLEYTKTPGVDIELVVTRFAIGDLATIDKQERFTEADMKQIVRIEGGSENQNTFYSIFAKGRGELKIIALHDRYSRGDYGYFLPGGERYVTDEREEFFCYFDPKDLKPPLNVYFSGYKTRQGFEGLNLMQKMGCPFLLISEPRLEGGAFYLGSEEYESLLLKTIQKYIRELGFSRDEVIMSGISMGSTGAAYYGCEIAPHAMLLGKPLMNIGSVAENEKLLRPGGFPTSLDVLKYIAGDLTPASVDKLNDRMWKRFEKVNRAKTKIIASYMLEDDYDDRAYEKMISEIRTARTELYGRGLHGRHNDNTGGIVNWFISQLKKMLREDFGRTFKE